MQASERLSVEAARALVAGLADAILPGENVRYVGQCAPDPVATRTFLVTDTRLIVADGTAVVAVLRGADVAGLDADADLARIVLAVGHGDPITLDRIPVEDLATVTEQLERLLARTDVSLAPPPPPSAGPLPPPTGSPVTAPSDAASFDVMLTAVGQRPIEIIKQVRAIAGLGLKQAKDLVDGLPLPVLEQVDGATAEDARQRLEKAGATIELRPRDDDPVPRPAVDEGDDASGTVDGWLDGVERTYGSALRGPAVRAVRELAHAGEVPWLIINPGGATGALVAFEDRCAIIKTGAMTGLLAGSLFGGRQAVFYFADITGIEYNSGLVTGVLEILTPSYAGTTNKDYWKGTLKSRNADSNDPFTLSNTLPLAKSEYRACQEHIAELRRRIAEHKRPVVVQQAAPQPPAQASSLAEELGRLAALHADGLLSDDEFSAAKQRLING